MNQEVAPSDSVFTGLMGEALERTHTEIQRQIELSVIRDLLDCPPGSRVLDVPCGAGRVAVALAGKGYEVTGIDIAPGLLASAQREAEAKGVRLHLEERDMRDLPWVGEFDAALCFWESFGYFDDAGNRAFLGAVARALKPGARFIFDTQIAESLFPKLHVSREWIEVGDILVLEAQHYDMATALWRRDWTLLRGDVLERRTTTNRIYTYRELCAMLSEVGFGGFEPYAFLSQRPFTPAAQRLLMAVTKDQSTPT